MNAPRTPGPISFDQIRVGDNITLTDTGTFTVLSVFDDRVQTVNWRVIWPTCNYGDRTFTLNRPQPTAGAVVKDHEGRDWILCQLEPGRDHRRWQLVNDHGIPTDVYTFAETCLLAQTLGLEHDVNQ